MTTSAESEAWPSIAAVIPCWNAEKWIEQAIRSVLGQNYPKLEVIVVDDGSTDGSLEIVKSFGGSIRWETGPNRGACAARNRGMALSRSDYILFLDADDYVEEQMLFGIAECIRRSDPDLIISPTKIKQHGRVSGPRVDWHENDIDGIVDDALRDFAPQGGAYCYRFPFLDSIGGWNESALRHQDVELRIRTLMHEPSYAINDRGAAVWCIRDAHQGISTDTRREIWDSVLRWHLDHVQRFKIDRHHRRAVAYGKRAYALARQLYANGWTDLGDEALSLARKVGFGGQLGSWKFRLTATVVGVRKAVALSRLLQTTRKGAAGPILGCGSVAAD